MLKTPGHLAVIDDLLAVYPDARIIHTHRDVARALGSQGSLCARMNSKLQRSIDLREIGDYWLDYSRTGLDRGLAVRDRLPASQIYDLRLKDLMAHPIDLLRDLYAHFELWSRRRSWLKTWVSTLPLAIPHWCWVWWSSFW